MRFVTFLASGGSVQAAAATESEELLRRSYDAGQLCLELAAEFISECLRAIGFSSGAITAQQLEEDDDITAWPPAEAHIYTFLYSSLQFAPFEEFLVQLCAAVEQQQQAHELARQLTREESGAAASAIDEDDEVSPLDWLMELIGLWCKVYRQLAATSIHFEEPLARINFHMLIGMHRLRLVYREKYQLLDGICNRLYRSALQGLFYRQAHEKVSTGLMNMFETNYIFFCQHEPGFLDFYYELFSVERQKNSYRLAFGSLTRLLQLPAALPKTILTDFLIETRMQEVYYTTLADEKTKRMLLAAMDFLNVLQRKLLDVDCLAKGLVSHIHALVLNEDPCIASLAAELYIAIMRRRLTNDKLILKQILEFALIRMSTPALLPHYVHTFWPHFPYMQTIDVYLEIIRNEDTATIMRLLCAQFLTTVYKEMMKNIAKYQYDIEHMLELLPVVLKEMVTRCNKTSGILLEMLRSSNLDLLERKLPSFMSLVVEFEKFAMQDFTDSTNYEYPLLMNLYGQMIRCLRFTQKCHRLERCAADICSKYFSIEKKLMLLTAEQPSAELLREYRSVLQKINLLLEFDYNLIGSFMKLYNTLRARLIDTAQIYEFIKENNYFIDLYAIGILTLGTIKVTTNAVFAADESAADMNRIAVFAPELAQHLVRKLSEMLQLSELPAVRIAVIFNNLVDLYCAFPATSTICSLPLKADDYHLLVETLLQLNFSQQYPAHASYRPLDMNDGGDEETQKTPQRIQEYQRLMLRNFTHLHTQIEIKSKISWKLCIYYGLPGQQFSAELGQLLRTIAVQDFPIYRHICAVMIFNLYKRQPALTDRAILAGIKAHKALIDEVTDATDATATNNAALLKVHIVLSVLTTVGRSLQVVRINADQNRLLSLKHLHVFIEHLNLSVDNVLSDILKQAEALRKQLLTIAEIRQLDAFVDICKKHQK